MEKPKQPLAAEFDQVIDFLDHQLRPNASWSIKDEYPLVFNEANRGNIRVIKENGHILSHAVSKYIIIKTPLGIFKVAAIGSVVTNPKFRNQGHSQKVLESTLEAAENYGCDFAILWTDLFDFYRKLGFELSGSEIALKIDGNFNPSITDVRIEETNNVSPAALLKLYNQHRVGTIRTPQDFQSFLKIPNMKVYTAWGADNGIKAYAVEGKGEDLQGYVHEWGGGVSHLMSLFSHIQKTQKKQITVISPRHSENLIRQMSENGAKANKGYLGMIKILNKRNLFFKMLRHSRSQGYDNFVMEKQADGFYFGVAGKVFKTDCERDIVRLLFGPEPASALHNFDPDTADMFNKLLPIPMWVWGWDSI